MRHLAQAPAAPDRSRVLHVGLPKTGTTALQAALHVARSDLAAQGVANAAPRRNRHPLATARFAVGHPLAHRPDAADNDWKRVVERLRGPDSRVSIFSGEALYLASSERARSIVSEVGGDVQVVVTLRAFGSQLRSLWQQSIVRGGGRTFDAWARARLNDATALRRDSPRAILESWAPAVGEDQIVFMISDPRDRNALFRRFEELLTLRDGTLEDTRIDNTALPAEGTEFLRQFNRLDTSRRTDPLSTRAKILRHGARQVQHMPGMRRDPVEVPQWAARGANEVADDWIRCLEASSATVVGQLDNLHVDPDDLPAQFIAPGQISVADAARYAYALCDAAVEIHEQSRATPTPRPEDLPTRQLLAAVRSRITRRLTGAGGGR